jgi:hypothetical protein
MRIVLTLPDGWREEVRGDRFVVTAPGGSTTIVVHPLGANPNLDDVARAALAWEAPGKAEPKVSKDEEAESTLSWPIRILHGEVGGDHRVCVVYRFLEYTGAAVASFGTSAPGDAARDVIDVLRTGRPDWSSKEIVALSELFSDSLN